MEYTTSQNKSISGATIDILSFSVAVEQKNTVDKTTQKKWEHKMEEMNRNEHIYKIISPKGNKIRNARIKINYATRKFNNFEIIDKILCKLKGYYNIFFSGDYLIINQNNKTFSIKIY
jgi:hypothetical protein